MYFCKRTFNQKKMTENNLNTYKDYHEYFTDLYRRATNMIAKMNDMPVSLDVVDRQKELRNLLVEVNQEAHEIWTKQSSNANLQTQPANEKIKDTIFPKFTQVFQDIHELYGEASGESVSSNRIRNFLEVEKQDFNNALNYHSKVSNRAFWALFAFIVFSLCAIAYLFNTFRFDLVKDLENLKPLYNLDKIAITLFIIKFTGKISILFGIAWTIKFLGNLHSKHSQQVITYQDRIAGLSAAEPIIISGNSRTREKILLKMADTYLNDKENAFKPIVKQVGESKENKITKSEILKLFEKTLDSVINQVSKK